jgi:hypothetical protein
MIVSRDRVATFPHHALESRRRCGLAGLSMILVVIRALITVVVGAIVFWFIDRYVRDRRLANLLKLLVVLVCLVAILERLLPMLGVNF